VTAFILKRTANNFRPVTVAEFSSYKEAVRAISIFQEESPEDYFYVRRKPTQVKQFKWPSTLSA